MDADVDDDDIGLGEYLKVRVKLNLYKPLIKGRAFEFSRKKYWLPLKYEKISRYCVLYGHIAHSSKCIPMTEDSQQFRS